MSRRALALFVLAACTHTEPNDPVDAAGVDGSVHVDDGTPMRRPCTNQFGTAITQSFGRLDGFLVAIVPPGTPGCNSDSDHTHLQILVKGAVYDVAVNIGAQMEDVHTSTHDYVIPSSFPWAEGWHVGTSFDYNAIGVHASDIPLVASATIESDLMTELSTVNHISVFGIGYGPEGVHLIHYNGNGRDGLVITQPLSTPSRARLFSFSDQVF